MKALRNIISAGAAMATGLGLAVAVSADDEKKQQVDAGHEQEQEEYGARLQTDVLRLSGLEGLDVQDPNGEQLGQVEDLAVNLESGELAFVLVSSGGFLGLGGDLHPVPPEALRIGGSSDERYLELNVDQGRWEDAPEVEREEIAQIDRQQIYGYYGEDLSEAREDNGAGRLELASDVNGTTVVDATREEIGPVSDLLVGLEEARISFVLVRPQDAADEYAVAPQALQVESEERFRLNVNRGDFEQARTLARQDVQRQAREQREIEIIGVRESPQLFRYKDDEEAQVFGIREQRQESADADKGDLEKAEQAQKRALEKQEEAARKLEEARESQR